MTTATYDIRLAAGFEIQPASPPRRTLNRAQAEQLVEALASDLARTVKGADQGLLVAAGAVFEPHELLRPELPAWSALTDSANPLIRERGLSPNLLAIGTHQGRMPDQRLSPSSSAVQGQFLVIPMLLIASEELGPELESQLERDLFERGSIDPPARAFLSEALGLESSHGQLLTANDLLALQHVQMDTAGLSGLWPVVEHVLLAPDETTNFDLAAGLQASWHAGQRQLVLHFLGLKDFPDSDLHAFGLWLRAMRMLVALCDSHAIAWRAEVPETCGLDLDGRLVSQNLGAVDQPDGAVQHVDEDFGLVAWSIIESGRLKQVYPLDAATANHVNQTLQQQFSDLATGTLAELKQ